jgi:PAS domain S-box-containing protein
MSHDKHALGALTVPVYTTDRNGLLTFYNDAAADLWGFRPEIGSKQWCGSWRLHRPDGTPLPFEDCPLAATLRQGAPVNGVEAVAERPDGSRVAFMPYPNLVRDDAGQVTGAINVLVELTERNQNDLQRERLAAIVSFSDDIIISKTLNGIIMSWNAAATRILGFEESEMIGQPIMRIIPPDRAHEEDDILRKIGLGERIEHFDTERLTKDGGRVHLSLTVSPLRDRTGRIVGVSKVARDITERKRSEELQKLLLAELKHRVKNTLATIQAIAGQSLRRSAGPEEFVDSFGGRVRALARAHDLLVRGEMHDVGVAGLIEEQVILGRHDIRITQSGPDVRLGPNAAIQLALVLHELATNARKHGALSKATGTLAITWLVTRGEAPELITDWREGGLQNLSAAPKGGFGSTLISEALIACGGSTHVEVHPDGLSCQIRLPLNEREKGKATSPTAAPHGEPQASEKGPEEVDLRGRKVLIVEDEAFIAMDIADLLAEVGMTVVGPARTLAQACKMAAAGGFDVALVDGNLNGDPVDPVADILAGAQVPFAFCSGYGREALPANHGAVPILAKPFGRDELLGVVAELCRRAVATPSMQG